MPRVRLYEPKFQARARARTVGVRARAVADYTDQLAELDDSKKLQPEEWQIIAEDIEKLIEELKAEYDGLASHLSALS